MDQVMMKWLARYVIFLALFLVTAGLVSLYLVIEHLPDTFTEKTTIIMGITSAIATGIGTMIGAVGGAFVAMSTSRKNISAAEARGDNE